jgi:PTS system nitrogen regulatory IIA component
MSNDTFDLDQLAAVLGRDARELHKLASRGHLPAKKVAGGWRFCHLEVNRWVEQSLTSFSDSELQHITRPANAPILADLLSEACVSVPLPARTASSVLRELVVLAEQSWQVYDPEGLLSALQTREQAGSTARAGGVALPHPHRPLPAALGESLVCFGRTLGSVPFGSPDRGLTDLFFLVCCRDSATHLQVLARLAQLLRQPAFVDGLRAIENPHDARQFILAAEAAL